MLRRPRKQKRWQPILYIALLAAVVAAMYFLSRLDQPVEMERGHSKGDTIDVAIEYSPLTYYTYGNDIGGFDHDLLMLFSRQQRRPVKFHPIVTLEQALAGLRDSSFDILVVQFPITAQAKREYLFTRPIYLDHQVLVQRKPAPVKSQLDLAGDTVWIVKGSPMKARIEGLCREIGDTIHIVEDPTSGAEQLLLRVAAGEIKQAVVNANVAETLADKLPKLDTSVDISLSQFQSWMLRHDEKPLADSINAWLDQAKATREYEQLKLRYDITTE